MVLDAVSNFVRGNTDAAVGTSDTTVSVVDASIFPDPATDGEFNVVIWDAENFPRPDQDVDVEILRVTARNTTTDELTVTRGQEMTSAAAHPEGSAIHLSPTAKMFSDIEDTFTTEAEAADAAPVQSVFGRVGDVVAETGDYAATQISNFSSEVLTSISGSTIAPSEITNLWNGTVVTADVNNTNTTTTALEAEELNSKSTLPGEYDQTINIQDSTGFNIDLYNLFDNLNKSGGSKLILKIRQFRDTDGQANLNVKFRDNNRHVSYRLDQSGAIQSDTGTSECRLISVGGASQTYQGRIEFLMPGPNQTNRVGISSTVMPARDLDIDPFEVIFRGGYGDFAFNFDLFTSNESGAESIDLIADVRTVNV